MNCIQYYYDKNSDAEKYHIECKEKKFENLYSAEKYRPSDMLSFVNENFSKTAFKEESPFEFSDNYINLSNSEICDTTDSNLGPQQKFMGQIMGESSNFNNMLIYHGLGSGKTCTSIVIGEALKNSSTKRMIYTVPAPLVDQYYEEISGEIRNGKFFSCPSFCLVKNGGKTERDFYVSEPQNKLLTAKTKDLEATEKKLLDIIDAIDKGDNSEQLKLQFKKLQVEIDRKKRDINNFQQSLRAKIIKTFEIISHQTFINQLYKTGANKQFIKNDKLLNFNSALFTENGLLVIDEIQRLVSESGSFYKKLYNSIKYYFHPKLKIVLMSATPIYDNPYELALTMNLLKPRIPFPIDKSKFYNFFIGEIDEKTDKCLKSTKNFVNENSCVLNKEVIKHLCSGYISYFKGGNPNAYPYKRIITMEHIFSVQHKSEYIDALRSDVKKDKIGGGTEYSEYQNLLLGNVDDTEKEDTITGMYVTTQQYSNIYFPKVTTEVNNTLKNKQLGLQNFKRILNTTSFQNFREKIDFFKIYSVKFANIIELALSSNGPVFIFSNWLAHGVEPLAAMLEVCGMVPFLKEDKGMGSFFIWSSETISKDKDKTLIKRAKSTFNSLANKDGSRLKIILGTRSVMEGVSFKNVKQVHITDPWWNESRIEQILARASRYCSHSSLDPDEQYVDIFRHYSTFSGEDDDAKSMLKETIGKEDFKNLHKMGFDIKMFIASDKKYFINNELNKLLKETAIDSVLNTDGNLVRLEEYITPISDGRYQMYYKNPSTGRKYIRDSIPNNITFEDVITRKYSYPNNKDFPIKFIEAGIQDTEILEPYSDSEIIEEPLINKDLILKENITPYLSENTFNELNMDEDIKNYFKDLSSRYNLIPYLRKDYLNETGEKNTKFNIDPRKNMKLMECIKKMAKENLVSEDIKRKIAIEFKRDKLKAEINKKILDIIYVYKLYPETYIEELLNIGIENPKMIDEILKTIS